MDLYETIFVRRSVRSYQMTPLDHDTLDDIRKYLAETKQLEGQRADFEIVPADAVGGGSAPHYILAYCGANAAAYMNVGYVLEKADLYLQSIGLGSLWMGMAKPKDGRGDFCILLAFGRTDVPRRQSTAEFKRLPLGEISDTDNAVAQAARLAPSAVNSQPWKLSFGKDKVTVRFFGRGMMKLVLKKKLNMVDLGIVTRHIVTALRHEGREIASILPNVPGKEFAIDVSYTIPQ